jgi:ABC-type sugar transport system ATPase subunit
MDEPTAALAVAEARKVLGFIDRLRARGRSVVLISHNIQDVFAISDRITVLRQGRRAAVRETRATTPEEIVGFITGAYVAARPAPIEESRPDMEATP